MQQITGVVKKVYRDERDGAHGPYTLTKIVLEDGFKYDAGTAKISVKEGDTVTFCFEEEKKYGAFPIVRGTFRQGLSTPSTPQQDPKSDAGPKTESSSMSKEEWAEKDRRIARQAAVKAAVQLVAAVGIEGRNFVQAAEDAVQAAEVFYQYTQGNR